MKYNHAITTMVVANKIVTCSLEQLYAVVIQAIHCHPMDMTVFCPSLLAHSGMEAVNKTVMIPLALLCVVVTVGIH